VVPATTRLVEEAGILRLRARQGQGGLVRDSDLLVGQLIAVANESFRREIGIIPEDVMAELHARVCVILGL
jgi:mRNA-degrading endonuclease toxin of MazEF toxin-antitoxin module